jgi:hypothetical protein
VPINNLKISREALPKARTTVFEEARSSYLIGIFEAQMFAVGSLLPFFKIGAVAAGFAFLVLTFGLLAKELSASQSGKRQPVRPKAIFAIFMFSLISLVFFLAGVFTERFLPDPFANYVTLDMGHYGFDTTTNTIKFQMAVAGPDTSRYVTKSDAPDYEAILGIREENQLPADDGTYTAVINHLAFATIDTREWKPSSPTELEMFQNKCVRFSIFGILKSEPHEIEIGSTFRPRDYKTVRLFESRSSGNHC